MKIARIFFVSLTIISLIIPYPLFASSFNPNFIISDEEMQYKNAMSVKDIASFLKSKGGYIADMITADFLGIQRSTAEIIYNAAQQYSINPKYILVKLQKEQSLITDPDPTQKQLDWAAGYAVCDSCSTNDPSIQKYKGFGKQVDNAAGVMRWYYDNVRTSGIVKKPNITYTIDGTTVVPANYATAFLYTYTPHLHGNENFWNLWQAWFDQVYPDGTLMTTEDNPEIYLLENGKRRQFKNMTSLITRYNPKLIVTVPDSELGRYPLGAEIALPNYSVVKQGSNYYLLDYDYKRKFETADTVKKIGYNPDEIIDVTTADIASYIDGPMITASVVESSLGKVVRLKETGTIYYIKDGMMSLVYDERLVAANFPNHNIETIPIATISNKYAQGEPVVPQDGTLLGIDGNNKIYVVEHGKKRHIASGDVFTALGYDWDNVIWVNSLVGQLLPDGDPLYMRADDSDVIAGQDTSDSGDDITVKQNPLELYMVRTPADETTYVGPQYTTNIESYIVTDYASGKILAGKNIDVVRPIASLTKVMSSYLMATEGLDPYEVVTYNPPLHKSTSHTFRIAEGEQYYVKDLLYAMLVSSLNTPVRMLVNRHSNDETNFISRMNGLAKSMGLIYTQFDDIAGLSDHTISTAREYATLYKKATTNATVKGYLATKSYEYDEVLDKDGKPHHYDTNNNRLYTWKHDSYEIISSKTGFTYTAGPCLAMHVRRVSDGHEFFVLSLGIFEYDDINARYQGFNDLTEWAMKTF